MSIAPPAPAPDPYASSYELCDEGYAPPDKLRWCAGDADADAGEEEEEEEVGEA